MSDAMREAFERSNIVPDDAEYNKRLDCYRYETHPGVSHPFNEVYESFKDGWQAALEHAGRGEPNVSDSELIDFASEEQFFLFCDEHEFIDIARAVLRRFGQPPAPAVPEGWKCVPFVPTQKMINEVIRSYPGRSLAQYAKGIYKAMINAAPEAPDQ